MQALSRYMNSNRETRKTILSLLACKFSGQKVTHFQHSLSNFYGKTFSSRSRADLHLVFNSISQNCNDVYSDL